MSLTFTEEEVKYLEDAICNSSTKRSYLSHKKDMKKFILSYFYKLKSSSGTNKVSGKKKSSDKNSSDKKSPVKNELVKKGSGRVYKIVKVSKNFEFPSSVYKKNTPDDAAKSAMKGIIKKNNLDDDVTFTFYVKTGDDTYKYTVKSGKLQI